MRITIAILALTSRLCCAALGSHMTLLSSVPVIFPFWHGNIAHGHVASKCRDVTFTVSATAENQVAADPPPDLLNLDASLTFLAQTIELTTVSGTQKLYGQYCEPTVKNHSRAKTLQFLVHGITYDHTYWAGFQTIPSSALYSWVNFANAQGYPTLAIDRLGNGRSDHPDPTTLVQAPYQVELFHDLIRQLRGSARADIPTSWAKIIYAGHSYGSVLATQLSSKHPQDIDSYILSGFAVLLPNENQLRGVVGGDYTHASLIGQERLRQAMDAPGYLTTSNKKGRADSFYSRPEVDFSSVHFDLDFDTRGTMAIGEALTAVKTYNSTDYTSPVYILTGQHDAMFCGNGSRTLGTPDCGSGATSQLAAVKMFYPAVPASDFDYYAQPGSGHCLQQHHGAVRGFVKAHAFLAYHGF